MKCQRNACSEPAHPMFVLIGRPVCLHCMAEYDLLRRTLLPLPAGKTQPEHYDPLIKAFLDSPAPIRSAPQA